MSDRISGIDLHSSLVVAVSACKIIACTNSCKIPDCLQMTMLLPFGGRLAGQPSSPVDHGPWTMVHGPWSMVHGPPPLPPAPTPSTEANQAQPWTMDHGPGSMDHGPWSMVHGPHPPLTHSPPQANQAHPFINLHTPSPQRV